ncbi:MAG: hypothetical protein U0795_23330 [Pirellulales bacterium]
MTQAEKKDGTTDFLAARRGALYSGQTLQTADWLESDNGLFRAGFESNGAFAVWSYSTNPIHRVRLWGMGNRERAGNQLFMNPAGRIEVITTDGARPGAIGCQPGNTYACRYNSEPFCVMQDDGNFVIYTHTPAGIKVIWASDTWRNNSQWRDLTIPGVVRVELSDGTVSPTLTKTLVNDTGDRLVVVDESQIVVVDVAGTIAISSPSDSVSVRAQSFKYSGDDGASDAFPVSAPYGPGQNVITIGRNAGGISLN